MTDSSSRGVYQYIKAGPRAGGDSILRTLLGFMVWWRIWAMYAVFATGFSATMHVSGDSIEVQYAFLFGLLTAMAASIASGNEYGIA